MAGSTPVSRTHGDVRELVNPALCESVHGGIETRTSPQSLGRRSAQRLLSAGVAFDSRPRDQCCVTRLVSRLPCHGSETDSISVRSANGSELRQQRGLQNRGRGFDSFRAREWDRRPTGRCWRRKPEMRVRFASIPPMGPSSNGKTPRWQRGNASSILAGSTKTGIALGCSPALQARRGGFDSHCLHHAAVAPRRSTPSVRERARSDSEQRLHAGFVQGERLGFQPSKTGSIPVLRSMQVRRQGAVPRCQRVPGEFDSRHLLHRDDAQHRVRSRLQTCYGSDHPRRASPRVRPVPESSSGALRDAGRTLFVAVDGSGPALLKQATEDRHLPGTRRFLCGVRLAVQVIILSR